MPAAATSEAQRPGDARVRERSSGGCYFIPRAILKGGGVLAMACTHSSGRADPEGRRHLDQEEDVMLDVPGEVVFLREVLEDDYVEGGTKERDNHLF